MSVVLEQHKVKESLMIRTVPATTGEGIEPEQVKAQLVAAVGRLESE